MHLLKLLNQFPTFKLKKILIYERAFCHSSYVNEHPDQKDYESLEFMGDSIIGFVVASFLYKKDVSFKNLTIIKNFLISGATLAKAAKKLNLQEYILGNKEIMKKGFNDSILADVFEAFTAAIFLNSGISVTKNFLNEHLIKPFFQEAFQNVDYRTTLQKYCQKDSKTLPIYDYKILKNGQFEVICKYKEYETKHKGINKKMIAKKAAYLMLKTLKII